MSESLSMDKGKTIFLIGGYNASSSSRLGIPTGLVGVLTGRQYPEWKPIRLEWLYSLDS